MPVFEITPYHRIAWKLLVALEPELAELERLARSHHEGNGRFCRLATWYGYAGEGIKDKLSVLIGWGRGRGPKVLEESDAYDIAYEYLYECMPESRGCDCC